jgi:hypothetical protein
MKANLIKNQEISLMKYAIGCKIMRLEEENDRIWFTNNQEEVEN